MGRPLARGSWATAVAAAVSQFGAEVTPRLWGPGEPENQLRSPTERLVRSVAMALGLRAELHGEVRLVDLKARPDYQVNVGRAPVGFIELKRPGKTADPTSFRREDADQWEKLKLLPNVLYSDGNEWALYRNGYPIGDVARFNIPIQRAGRKLASDDGEFLRVLKEFLYWEPQPPRTISELIDAIANLCRLLRTEVRTAMELEARGRRTSLYRFLADDWRNLLFPDASDDTFADQYAQTVTFALLLARVEGIDFEGEDLSGIARKLDKKHLLLGRALGVLTHDSLGDLGTSLETLTHVIGAIDWDLLKGGPRETYLWLYEDFLAAYDPLLRQQTGSYYTPNEVARYMVQATDQLLRSKLGVGAGFAAPQVIAIDPAMGTGTFLVEILQQIADTIIDDESPETVGPRLREIAGNRLIGFERQIGPFAIAELRIYDVLRHKQSDAPADGLRLYIADTLDSPWVQQTQLGVPYRDIAASREQANRVKRDEPVMVAVGNPPHDKAIKGAGKWIETGQGGPTGKIPLDAFRSPGNGRYEYVLTNLWVYFWRWATWKVFDHHKDVPSGVVVLISPSAYLSSRGFAGMRRYLRQTADEGWIIDLSPEGHRPDVPTRIFPEVQQPLCIGIFARRGPPQQNTPATIHYLAVAGQRGDKFRRLTELTFDDPAWASCPTDWHVPFRPERDPAWMRSPRLEDLYPWSSRGVTPGRTWVYAPDKETLTKRWRQFVGADMEERRQMFREARDRKLNTVVGPLPGIAQHSGTLAQTSTADPLEPVLVGHRAFDRKWLIPDNRLMVVPRPDLWRVRSSSQIYMTASVHPIKNGPAVTFTAHIPDMHHYNGRSGRAIPLYRDAKATAPNLPPRLLPYLTRRLGTSLTPEDMLAYVAGVVAHPAYTQRFLEELVVPGVRVPLTADCDLWEEAVRLGREVLWLYTYGERCVDPAAGRTEESPRLPGERRPRVVVKILDTEVGMPTAIDYHPQTETLQVGAGRIKPVLPQVWTYEVSGWRVVKRWFDYRKRSPRGRRSSKLDHVVPTYWRPDFTTELLTLLQVLGRLVELHPAQADLLDRICATVQITTAELEETAILPPPARIRRPVPPEGLTLLDSAD
jgi:type ISP restriction-modification system protein/N-6 DNA methylase